jgi:putative ABC transport system permease protein
VLAFSISRRTREIGIRMALGARAADVHRLVVRGGVRLALIGITIGLFGALAAGRVLASLLYGVSAADPLTFAIVALLFLAVAALASWIPARRAARLDPAVALRED